MKRFRPGSNIHNQSPSMAQNRKSTHQFQPRAAALHGHRAPQVAVVHAGDFRCDGRPRPVPSPVVPGTRYGNSSMRSRAQGGSARPVVGLQDRARCHRPRACVPQRNVTRHQGGVLDGVVHQIRQQLAPYLLGVRLLYIASGRVDVMAVAASRWDSPTHDLAQQVKSTRCAWLSALRAHPTESASNWLNQLRCDAPPDATSAPDLLPKQ